MEEGLIASLSSFESGTPGTGEDPYMMNGLILAYIGDAVFEILVREKVIREGGRHVEKLHKDVTKLVNAGAQSELLRRIEGLLTEKEQSVYRRGRNSKAATAAKNQSISDYRRATGLEALFGYLYLSHQNARLHELFEKGMQTEEV